MEGILDWVLSVCRKKKQKFLEDSLKQLEKYTSSQKSRRQM